jgi:GR25 family glycosyltransferase involved in LPS biosynthesis
MRYSAATIGCALSHVGLWNMAAQSDLGATVFEDDAVVSHEFESLAQRVMSLLPPDWDMVLWGYVLNPTFVWVGLGVTRAVLRGYGERRFRGQSGLSEFQGSITAVTPVRVLHCFGLQAYSISPKGARAALRHCLPLRRRMIVFPDAGIRTPDEGIDCALCDFYPNSQAFWPGASQ